MAYPPSPSLHPGVAGSGRSNAGLVVSIAAAAVALLATLGVAIWNYGIDPVTTVVAPAPTPTVTSTEAPGPTEIPPPEPTPTPEPPPEPTPEPTPTPEPPPPASFPPGARPCAAVTGPVGGFTSSAAGNSVTSCPFAEEVRKSYGANPVRNAPVVIPAYSPVTEVTYEMSCSGERLVTCTGGNNAVVYLI